MYAALDEKDQLINAIDCDKAGKFKCPNCQRPVVLIRGEKTPFFKHESEHYNEINERPVHKKGKSMLMKALRDSTSASCQIEEEVYLEDIDQRPDIMVDGKTVIEYQCAKLDLKRLSKRVNSYKDKGLENLWILGGDYLSEKITKQHLKFLSYNPSWRFYIVMLNTETKKLSLFYEVRFVGPFNRLAYHKKTFAMKNFRHFLDFQPKQDQIKQVTISEHQIERIRRINDPKINRFKTSYYQRHHQRVEDFLVGQKFEMLKPIYQTYHWMMKCGSTPRRIRQPLLNATKKLDQE
ncbi:competence protein CoiA [Companilactobacillus furfuricola]|uniref:competence protein CoiA n=1 Tax=Companilactobacillus furfuricola TaxID=1462575 RepID=UPI000F785073|nr:competence protein CoiA family protein [Companilactobacillus furfuricola]